MKIFIRGRSSGFASCTRSNQLWIGNVAVMEQTVVAASRIGREEGMSMAAASGFKRLVDKSGFRQDVKGEKYEKCESYTRRC